MCRLNEKKGSLLLEALLSIVILSTSITLIIRAMTSSLRAVSYSKEYTDAVFLVENEMFEYISQGFVDLGSVGEKTIKENGKEYKYNLQAKDFNDTLQTGENENIAEVMEVVSTLSWKSKARENDISLATLLFESTE